MHLLIIIFAKYLFLVVVGAAGVYTLLSATHVKKQLAKLAMISLPFSFLLLKIAAALYFNPRPFVLNHLQPLIAHSADNGFPSDHTTLCVTLSSLVFIFNKKLGLVLYTLSLLIGISRVLALVHHPIDIAAGFAVGMVSVYAVWFFLKRTRFI